MNERIKELAEQAQPDPIAYRVEHFQGSVGYWDKNEPVWKSGLYQESKEHFTCKPLYTQEDLKKFAELLIKETTNVIIKGHKGHMNPAMAYDSVKQHFGVEE